jgi:hypothetical protein
MSESVSDHPALVGWNPIGPMRVTSLDASIPARIPRKEKCKNAVTNFMERFHEYKRTHHHQELAETLDAFDELLKHAGDYDAAEKTTLILGLCEDIPGARKK